MFARHGFESVTLELIGVAAGFAGATVYNYCPSEQEILSVGVTRANE